MITVLTSNMKKKEYIMKLRSTDNLVNECPNSHCMGKIVLEMFVGKDEGSNALNGKKIFLGLCSSCRREVLYKTEIIFDAVKGYIFAVDELGGEYRIVKVN